MANTEEELRIIAEIERLDFAIPNAREDAEAAFICGSLSTLTAVGIFAAGKIIDNWSGNRLGVVPEAVAASMAALPLALGTVGLVAAGVNAAKYHRLRHQS